MKKKKLHFDSEHNSNVKEISDGVYINLNRITSEEGEFEKAVEESFKDLNENDEDCERRKQNATNSKKS